MLMSSPTDTLLIGAVDVAQAPMDMEDTTGVLMWQSLGDAVDSCKEAKAAAKKLDLGTAGKWRVDRACPGDGVARAQLQCNAHDDCPFRLIIRRRNGEWCVMSTGQHGTQVREKARKNSVLTFEEQAQVRTSVKTGAKPAELLAAMTDDMLEDCKGKGITPEKRDGGGLKGGQQKDTAYRFHIPCIFCSYSCHILCIS